MAKRFPFPGLPNGWYVVATSAEVRPGALISRRYFERELVIYRTTSGRVQVADAFCPHMGAHLGRVGRVQGDLLRCTFHGFCYDAAGTCVETPYGGPPPPRAVLDLWQFREQNGLILVWFDPAGRPPAWEVPEQDMTGWNKTRWRTFRIPTHPQETTENSVDFGHFTQIHGFVDGSIQRPVDVEGPLLTTSYRAYRPYGLVPGKPLVKIQVDYDVAVWGLGYSQVEVMIPALRMPLRVWILPVPIDEEHLDLRVGLSTRSAAGPLAPVARYFSHRIVCWEVEQDLDVWTYKAYRPNPALAKSDRAVGIYRRYVKQFYSDAAPSTSVPASEAVRHVATA